MARRVHPSAAAPPKTAPSSPGFGLRDTADASDSVRHALSEPAIQKKTITFFGDRGEVGFSVDHSGQVIKVDPGSQAAVRGVQVGWRVTNVDGDRPRLDDNLTLLRQIKMKQAKGGGDCDIMFTLPPPEPEGPDMSKVDSASGMIAKLHEMTEEARLGNLDDLQELSGEEKGLVLETPSAVQGIFAQEAGDELTVLLGEKTAGEIRRIYGLWNKLRLQTSVNAKELQEADLGYTDREGNNAMHMVQTASQAECIMEVSPQLLMARNNKGETAVAHILEKTSRSSQVGKLLKLFIERAPGALNAARMDGISMPIVRSEADASNPAMPWPEVREVLLVDNVKNLQAEFRKAGLKVKKARPALDVSDHAAVWSELLFEHCFGNDVCTDDEHTDVSFSRLRDVWQALEMLLRAVSDIELPVEEAGELKDIAKGLLVATKGPEVTPVEGTEGFDPRQPYRKDFLKVIHVLQSRTATMLRDVLAAAQEKEPDSVGIVQQYPADQLHDVDTGGSDFRKAKGRLRMDSMVVADGKSVSQQLRTPPWILGQYLDEEAWQGLKCSGVIERAADIVRLAQGTLNIDGMTVERSRFCRLHAAWLRGYCNGFQTELTQQLQAALDLKDPPTSMAAAGGAVEAVGGASVHLFRARSEAKGVPRIIEKMTDALYEEVPPGDATSLSLLKKDFTKQLVEKEGAKRISLGKAEAAEIKALLELLTPACYVCDINGAEVVVDSFADLAAIYKELRRRTLIKDGHQVVRTKNGFSSDVPQADIDAKGGYRDLKVWLTVKVGEATLPAELQLHTRGFYELKRVMHLPYECSRGSFDHAHLAKCWQDFIPEPEEQPEQPKSEEKTPPKSCCASCQIM